MKAIRKGAMVRFIYNGQELVRPVIQKSGSLVLVLVPVTYLGGEVHQTRAYISISTITEIL